MSAQGTAYTFFGVIAFYLMLAYGVDGIYGTPSNVNFLFEQGAVNQKQPDGWSMPDASDQLSCNDEVPGFSSATGFGFVLSSFSYLSCMVTSSSEWNAVTKFMGIFNVLFKVAFYQYPPGQIPDFVNFFVITPMNFLVLMLFASFVRGIS